MHGAVPVEVHRRRGEMRRLSLVLSVAVLAALPASAHAVQYSQPIFVDKQLAGGEPLVATDGHHKTLVYTSHEGTTHLYQPGFFSPPPHRPTRPPPTSTSRASSRPCRSASDTATR